MTPAESKLERDLCPKCKGLGAWAKSNKHGFGAIVYCARTALSTTPQPEQRREIEKGE